MQSSNTLTMSSAKLIEDHVCRERSRLCLWLIQKPTDRHFSTDIWVLRLEDVEEEISDLVICASNHQRLIRHFSRVCLAVWC